MLLYEHKYAFSENWTCVKVKVLICKCFDSQSSISWPKWKNWIKSLSKKRTFCFNKREPLTKGHLDNSEGQVEVESP